MPKTIAIRLDDDLHAAATAVAQLQGISLTELIRTAIENYLQAQRDGGQLASQAEQALAEIEAEAESRRKAIQGLLTPGVEAPVAEAKTTTAGRGRKTAQEGT